MSQTNIQILSVSLYLSSSFNILFVSFRARIWPFADYAAAMHLLVTQM